MHFEWNGVFPALTTKFTADDQLDLPLFEKNLQAQLNAGVHGIVLGGTLGEASVLTTAEKEQLVQFAVEKCAGKVPVILNIAEGSTREALQQAVNAKTWGAQGLMMLPPMRYKSDHRETVTYFKTVADSTDLPIMIYNFGMAVAMPSLTLLALEHFPTHRGLASSCQSFLQMLVSSVTAGLIAPALWGSVLGLASGMAGFVGLGLACSGLWWLRYHRALPAQPPA